MTSYSSNTLLCPMSWYLSKMFGVMGMIPTVTVAEIGIVRFIAASSALTICWNYTKMLLSIMQQREIWPN